MVYEAKVVGSISGLMSLVQDRLPLLIFSFFIGAAGACLTCKLAYILDLIDEPNSRSSHCTPTPKGGGIGITITLALVSITCSVPFSFWMPIIFLSLISLLGDRSHISPYTRLIIQFVTAGMVLTSFPSDRGLITNFLLIMDNDWRSKLIVLVVATIFMVITTNFYNFMDGINGIAAISGTVGFGLLATYGLSINATPVMIILCLCVASACLGFLPFNLPKAKVFLGDTGSILLGFLFAATTLFIAQKFQDVLLMAGFLFPFYADELTTMIERIKDGQDLIKPHRRHLYQILANEAKIEHWKISTIYGVVQLGMGLLFWKAKTISFIVFMISTLCAGALFYIVNNKIKKKFSCNTLT